MTDDRLIDMLKIRQIESSNDPSAVSPKSGATGFHQILPKGKNGALDDWNLTFPKEQYDTKDLYDPNINYKIASWYANTRIPEMLKSHGQDDTLENRLASYNWGVGNLSESKKTGEPMRQETIDYIKKYKDDPSNTELTYNIMNSRGVQTALKDLGLYRGDLDGIIGPKSEQAIKNFQKSVGIKVDGIAGPITKRELLKAKSK